MKPTGTLRLTDKRTRVVAVYGPLAPGRRRPRLLVEEYGKLPEEVGAFCFGAKDRVAKFMVPEGAAGDQLLDLLDRHPLAKARPVRSYGIDGWAVQV
ncbi:MAG TPA: hypothetical protein VLA54_00125 [Acidimicrobiia bacterium]|nr:hypothetical protein [Acidimicrobiia bacterium]